VARSSEKRDVVIASGNPWQSGEHEVEIAVPGCRAAECEIGLLVLRQGSIASDEPSLNVHAFPSSPGEKFITYDNYDLIGDDLRPNQNAEIGPCALECESDRSCVAYTFDKWNHRCFLKSSSELLKLDPNSTTGLRSGIAKPTVASTSISMRRLPGKAFPYAGQSTSRAESSNDCERRCKQDQVCVAFTYFKGSGQCRLMATAGKYFADDGADSGFKLQELSQ
jgi:hypothetical protein